MNVTLIGIMDPHITKKELGLCSDVHFSSNIHCSIACGQPAATRGPFQDGAGAGGAIQSGGQRLYVWSSTIHITAS